MSNNFRLTITTQAGSAAVVPAFVGDMAAVCPRDLSARPRTIDGFATAHKGQGPQSWSPPSP